MPASLPPLCLHRLLACLRCSMAHAASPALLGGRRATGGGLRITLDDNAPPRLPRRAWRGWHVPASSPPPPYGRLLRGRRLPASRAGAVRRLAPPAGYRAAWRQAAPVRATPRASLVCRAFRHLCWHVSTRRLPATLPAAPPVPRLACRLSRLPPSCCLPLHLLCWRIQGKQA